MTKNTPNILTIALIALLSNNAPSMHAGEVVSKITDTAAAIRGSVSNAATRAQEFARSIRDIVTVPKSDDAESRKNTLYNRVRSSVSTAVARARYRLPDVTFAPADSSTSTGFTPTVDHANMVNALVANKELNATQLNNLNALSPEQLQTVLTKAYEQYFAAAPAGDDVAAKLNNRMHILARNATKQSLHQVTWKDIQPVAEGQVFVNGAFTARTKTPDEQQAQQGEAEKRSTPGFFKRQFEKFNAWRKGRKQSQVPEEPVNPFNMEASLPPTAATTQATSFVAAATPKRTATYLQTLDDRTAAGSPTSAMQQVTPPKGRTTVVDPATAPGVAKGFTGGFSREISGLPKRPTARAKTPLPTPAAAAASAASEEEEDDDDDAFSHATMPEQLIDQDVARAAGVDGTGVPLVLSAGDRGLPVLLHFRSNDITALHAI